MRADPSFSPLPTTTTTTQEVAKAREMDALKRNLFNVRNDLENVFRTTLHDLNVAYQDQAFDDMVEEATTWVLCCTLSVETRWLNTSEHTPRKLPKKVY